MAKTVYVLNTNLVAGDIVLLRAHSFASSIIAAATLGNFSHVGIFNGKDSLIEAMPHGVAQINLRRIFLIDKDNIAVYRINTGDIELDQRIALKAANLAGKLETGKYSKLLAILSVLGGPAPTADDVALCN